MVFASTVRGVVQAPIGQLKVLLQDSFSRHMLKAIFFNFKVLISPQLKEMVPNLCLWSESINWHFEIQAMSGI